MSHRRGASAVIRLVLAGSLLIVGTASCSNGGTIFSSSADPADVCGREHAAFADSQSFYFQQVAQGAVFGALGGAALGALAAAGQSHGDVAKGAAIGAGAGALVGGAAGYFNARQQQAADQAALANSIYGDIGRAAQEMDRATTTFAALRGCRFAAADRIKAAFRQGTLPREQAAAQLADQQQRFDKELALARQYGAKMAEQDEQFRFAADSLVKQDPAAQQAVASRAARMGTGDFVATAATVVHSAPVRSADQVASLERGQRVHGMAEKPIAGWRKVALEDGTSGYVMARVLSPIGAAPASAAAAKPPAGSSRDVDVAVAATETIPEKRVAYSRAVDDAAKQSNLSFNLDQAS
jgi:hypothetical protein